MKRFLDILISSITLLIASPILIILSILIKIDSAGPIIFKQKRIGRYNTCFTIYKFRTMKTGTPNLPTHLIVPSDYVTKLGCFLRKSSLDELPQLYNILKGDMSLVGPRPALYNQDELISLRNNKGISKLKPGLTGWAQVNGRDDISDNEKVVYDEFYFNNISIILDLRIVYLTFFNVIRAKGVKV